MSVMLTCPVCERSQIETNTCPNCETDLSTYRMLTELPVEIPVETFVETKKPKAVPIWLPVGIAILLLLLGMVLGAASNSVIAKQPQVPTAVNVIKTPVEPKVFITPVAEEPTETEVKQSEAMFCSGFNYLVRRGDSLSSIAARFYGNSSSWSLITRANPALEERSDSIEIGERLLVPNRESNCG